MGLLHAVYPVKNPLNRQKNTFPAAGFKALPREA
jgi:hypothetical protein